MGTNAWWATVWGTVRYIHCVARVQVQTHGGQLEFSGAVVRSRVQTHGGQLFGVQ